ncbi:M48 family metallopeptidase [Kosakonia sp. BYX6]|uniref:M48 family metallopeptidase n=1 Tax=Kosakonia calanthes TaxID=3139408 RepID=A0ABZ3B822_9ENTR
MDKKSLFYCFGLPLLLLAWSLWQCSRISENEAWVVIEWGTRAHNLHTEISRLWLAYLSLFLSALALFASTSAVILCLRSVQKARLSRDQLVAAFKRCRNILPVAMVTLMSGIGFALVCLLFSEYLSVLTFKDTTVIPGTVLLLPGIILASLIFMVLRSLVRLKRCFTLFQPQDRQVYGAAVLDIDAPELWRWVRELAQRAQALTPDNIVVGLFEGFYVTVSPVQLASGARLTGKTLYFPLAYAALMNRQEVAAVIVHELAHFTGRDTDYTLHFAGLYSGMETSLDYFHRDLTNSDWLDRLALYPTLHLGVWFFNQFHETVNGWSRERELAADALGASISSPRALASSLLRLPALDAHFDVIKTMFFERKLRTTNLVDTFYNSLRDIKGLDVSASLDQTLAHPTDSHPPTGVRIAHLTMTLDEALLMQASRPASEADYAWMRSLFRDSYAICEVLTGAMNNQLAAQYGAYREKLENIAAQAMDSVVVTMPKNNVWGFVVISILFGISSGVLWGLSRFWHIRIDQVDIIVVGLLVLAASFGFGGWCSWKRIRHPLLTLHPQQITSDELSAPLALASIENTHFGKRKGQLFIDLYWREGYQPPKSTVSRYLRAFIITPKKRRVSISMLSKVLRNAQGEKIASAELYALINDYIRAAHAREALNNS